MSVTFADLGLRPELVETVNGLGFTEPTDIQSSTIPLVLAGGDFVGLSPTGSGKTAAFGLPILHSIDPELRQVQALVVCPTRELGLQVAAEIRKLAGNMRGLQIEALYGGAPIGKQIEVLRRGPQIVVGTPGRLSDHLRRGTLRVDRVGYTVLDEADRMLDMGFREEMESLLDHLPENKQMLFFSATMNSPVRRLIDKFGNSPQTVEIKGKNRTADSVTQQVCEVSSRGKFEVLSRLIEVENPRLSIVFANTKAMVDRAADYLAERGHRVDRLHGDMNQVMRERVMNAFRTGKIRCLVATDVAGRGLDVDDIDLVINLEIPRDSEDYIHRIGRTGRAGREGLAINLITNRELGLSKYIQKATETKFVDREVPKMNELIDKRRAGLIKKVFADVKPGESEEHIKSLKELVEDPDLIIEALWQHLEKVSFSKAEKLPEDDPTYYERLKNERESRRHERGDRDRGDRRERRPREGGRDSRDGGGRDRDRRGGGRDDRSQGPRAGYKSVYMGIGSRDGAQPGEITGMLYRTTGIEDQSIGPIKILTNFSLVQVKESQFDKLVDGAKGLRYRGRPIPIREDRG